MARATWLLVAACGLVALIGLILRGIASPVPPLILLVALLVAIASSRFRKSVGVSGATGAAGATSDGTELFVDP